MKAVRRSIFVLSWTLGAGVSMSACGGRSGEVLEAGCVPLSCPSDLAWDDAACACIQADSAAPSAQPDASEGSTPPIDATALDAGVDATVDGAPSPAEAGASMDATLEDASYVDQGNPGSLDGSVADASPNLDATVCQCPLGTVPELGCTVCVRCEQCPSGFTQADGCGCVPLDAGPTPPPPPPSDAGVSCLLGFDRCAAGSWCELGVCPDDTTQYGCFCNPDGTATCSLTCPKPPDCDFPGLGTCPFGSQCVSGSCASDAAAGLFVCSCNGAAGRGFCNTTPCADGGSFTDAGPFNQDAGTTCVVGDRLCTPGNFCSLGSCPDGTPFGCTCNADGSEDCTGACPAPLPCEIPGSGTCASGGTCTFGSCSGTSGTTLRCSCFNGNASCTSTPCSDRDGG